MQTLRAGSPGIRTEQRRRIKRRQLIAATALRCWTTPGKPVARSLPGFEADWKHPFVATEIGDALPHWEAALYLTDPGQITKSANTLRLTVSLIVLLLVVAIVAGGSR